MKLVTRARRLAPVAVAVAGLAAAGCGSSSSSSSKTAGSTGSAGGSQTASSATGSGTGSSSASQGAAKAKAAYEAYETAPKTIVQTTPLKHAPAKGGSIIYIINSVPADTQIGQTMAEAAKAIGWSYSSISYDPANPATIQQAFNSALAKHPTAVAIGGVAPDQFGSQTLPEYAKAGIPIIAASTYPVHPTKTLLGPANGIQDTITPGRALGEWFVSDSNGKGSALLVNAPAFPIFGGMVKGFQESTQKYCGSSCKTTVLNLTAAELGNGGVVPAVVNYLRSHQSIKYVFFCLGNFADGITQGLSSAGLSDVKVGGSQMDSESAGDLRAKTEAVWMINSNYYTGLMTIDFALRHSEGMSTATDATEPFQLFTQANIGKVVNWNAPYNSLEQFEKLWHVPVTNCTVACNAG